MIKLLYFVCLVLLACALWWAVACGGWMAEGDLRERLVTLGLQVLVFGLAGGGVKLLLDEAAARREFRTDVLRSLGQAHKQVYRVRRLLERVEKALDEARKCESTPVNRAVDRRASTADQALEAEKTQLLGELMDVRADLGGVRHEVRPWTKRSERVRVQQKVEGMRDYLEEVVRAADAAADDKNKKLYTEFLETSPNSASYLARFKRPYQEVKKLVDPKFEDPSADKPDNTKSGDQVQPHPAPSDS